MTTIIYKKIEELHDSSNAYDYIVKYPKYSIELKRLDYLVPKFKNTLILNGKKVNVLGSIFDLDSDTLKVLIS